MIRRSIGTTITIHRDNGLDISGTQFPIINMLKKHNHISQPADKRNKTILPTDQCFPRSTTCTHMHIQRT